MVSKADLSGRPASKEEVLEILGHPSTWGEASRRAQFHMCSNDRNELTETSKASYLTYLKESLMKPAGYQSGLVSEEEDQKIFENEQKAIRAEIERIERGEITAAPQ